MLKIDLHIHTIQSTHAYGSFYEVLKTAKSRRLKMIGIADHGPDTEGSPGLIHFKMGRRAPKKYKGMDVLWGCESNMINKKGDIDLDESTIKRLDILLMGNHKNQTYKDQGKKANTEALIKCFNKYPILIFTHPVYCEWEYDKEKVFKAAFDNNILLELNLSSLRAEELGYEKERIQNLKKMIDFVRKNNKKVIVNSDAHFLHEIGEDSPLKKQWNKLGLSNDLIINNYPGELKELIASKDPKKFKLK